MPNITPNWKRFSITVPTTRLIEVISRFGNTTNGYLFIAVTETVAGIFVPSSPGTCVSYIQPHDGRVAIGDNLDSPVAVKKDLLLWALPESDISDTNLMITSHNELLVKDSTLDQKYCTYLPIAQIPFPPWCLNILSFATSIALPPYKGELIKLSVPSRSDFIKNEIVSTETVR